MIPPGYHSHTRRLKFRSNFGELNFSYDGYRIYFSSAKKCGFCFIPGDLVAKVHNAKDWKNWTVYREKTPRQIDCAKSWEIKYSCVQMSFYHVWKLHSLSDIIPMSLATGNFSTHMRSKELTIASVNLERFLLREEFFFYLARILM